MVHLEGKEEGELASATSRVQMFPRFDVDSPRCGEGGTMVLRAANLPDLGTLARATLPTGSRVILVDKTDGVTALLLNSKGSLAPWDVAQIKLRALVRAIRCVETILRCDGELAC